MSQPPTTASMMSNADNDHGDDNAGVELERQVDLKTKRENLSRLIKALPTELRLRILVVQIEDGMVDDCLNGEQMPLFLQALEKEPAKDLYAEFRKEYDRIHARLDFLNTHLYKRTKMKDILNLEYLTLVAPLGYNFGGHKFSCANKLSGVFFDLSIDSSKSNLEVEVQEDGTQRFWYQEEWLNGFHLLLWIIRANDKSLSRVVTRTGQGNTSAAIERVIGQFDSALGVKHWKIDKGQFAYYVWTLNSVERQSVPGRSSRWYHEQ